MSTAHAPPAPPQHMHPAWYGAVMSTGVLALCLDAQASQWSWMWLSRIAAGLLMAATVLGVALLPRYVKRLKSRGDLAEEMGDVGRGPMLATLPAGLLILADGWGRIGQKFIPTTAALWISALLLVLGTVIALVVALAWTTAITRTNHRLEDVNGGWLIPPVMNALVPVALSALIVANPSLAPLLVYVGAAFLGVGIVLFLALFAILMSRLTLRGPTPASLAPSLWIPLAPAGILGLAAMRLTQSAQQAAVTGFDGVTVACMMAALGIGFGLWWTAFAALEMRRISTGGVTAANPGWWAFVFPAGAMALSLSTLGALTDITAICVAGLIATAGLTIVWMRVAYATLRPQRH